MRVTGTRESRLARLRDKSRCKLSGGASLQVVDVRPPTSASPGESVGGTGCACCAPRTPSRGPLEPSIVRQRRGRLCEDWRAAKGRTHYRSRPIGHGNRLPTSVIAGIVAVQPMGTFCIRGDGMERFTAPERSCGDKKRRRRTRSGGQPSRESPRPAKMWPYRSRQETPAPSPVKHNRSRWRRLDSC